MDQHEGSTATKEATRYAEYIDVGTDLNRLLTEQQVAERWQCAMATLRNQRSLRTGCRYLKIDGKVRYRLTDVIAYEDAAVIA